MSSGDNGRSASQKLRVALPRAQPVSPPASPSRGVAARPAKALPRSSLCSPPVDITRVIIGQEQTAALPSARDYVAPVTQDRPRAMVSDEVREAAAMVLEMMVATPSNQQHVAAALGFTQPAISRAILAHNIGPMILQKLIAFLETRGAIAERTEKSFMRTFGPDIPDAWTWDAVAALANVSEEQRKAVKLAKLRGATAAAIGSVLTHSPWTHRQFRDRSSEWWTSEMLTVAALSPEQMPRVALVKALPEWTVAESERERSGKSASAKQK